MTSSPLNRRLKGWGGWFVVLALAVVLVVFGASRDNGPMTSPERAVAIEQSLACPACSGETVFESGHPAARNIRNEVRRLVTEGQLSDGEIINYFSTRYGDDIRLLPRAEGSDAAVWALPAAAAVALLAGLIVAFRRWRTDATVAAPTTDERRRVAAALAAEAQSDAATGADAGDSADAHAHADAATAAADGGR